MATPTSAVNGAPMPCPTFKPYVAIVDASLTVGRADSKAAANVKQLVDAITALATQSAGVPPTIQVVRREALLLSALSDSQPELASALQASTASASAPAPSGKDKKGATAAATPAVDASQLTTAATKLRPVDVLNAIVRLVGNDYHRVLYSAAKLEAERLAAVAAAEAAASAPPEPVKADAKGKGAAAKDAKGSAPAASAQPTIDPTLATAIALLAGSAGLTAADPPTHIYLLLDGPKTLCEAAAILSGSGAVLSGTSDGAKTLPIAPPTAAAAVEPSATAPAADLTGLLASVAWAEPAPVPVSIGCVIELTVPPPPATPQPDPAAVAAAAAGGKDAKGKKPDPKGAAAAASASSLPLPLTPAEQFTLAVDAAWGMQPATPSTAGAGADSAISDTASKRSSVQQPLTGARLLRGLQAAFRHGETLCTVGVLMSRMGLQQPRSMGAAIANMPVSYADVRDVCVPSILLEEGQEVGLPAVPAPAAEVAAGSAAAPAAAPTSSSWPASAQLLSPEGLAATVLSSINTAIEESSSFRSWLSKANVSRVPSAEQCSLAELALKPLREQSSTTPSALDIASLAARHYLHALAPVPLAAVGIPSILFAAVDAIANACGELGMTLDISDDHAIAVPAYPALCGPLTVVEDAASSGTTSSGRVGGQGFHSPGHMIITAPSKQRSRKSTAAAPSSNAAVAADDVVAGDPADATLVTAASLAPTALRLPILSTASSGHLVPFREVCDRYADSVAASHAWYKSHVQGAAALPATSPSLCRLARAAASAGCSLDDLRFGVLQTSFDGDEADIGSVDDGARRGLPLALAERIVLSSLRPWKPVARGLVVASASSTSLSASSSSAESSSATSGVKQHGGMARQPTPGSTSTELAELAAISPVPRDVLSRTLALRTAESTLQCADTASAAAYVRQFEQRGMIGSEAASLHPWSLSSWSWALDADDEVSLCEMLLAVTSDAGIAPVVGPDATTDGTDAEGSTLSTGGVSIIATRDPTSGSTILALHTLTPRRRVDVKRITAADVIPASSSARPSLADWKSSIAAGNSAAAAPAAGGIIDSGMCMRSNGVATASATTAPSGTTAAAAPAAPSAAAGDAATFFYNLYPADHSIVQARSTDADGGVVLVSKSGCTFGLRSPPSSSTGPVPLFTADFPGDCATGCAGSIPFARITVRMEPIAAGSSAPGRLPKGKGKGNAGRAPAATSGNAVTTYSTDDGLVVTASSDGWVTQQYIGATGTAQAAPVPAAAAGSEVPASIAAVLPDGAAQSIAELVHRPQLGMLLADGTAAPLPSERSRAAAGAGSGTQRRRSTSSRPNSASSSSSSNALGAAAGTVSPPNAQPGALPLPTPLGTPEPVCASQFPSWPAWLPEVSRTTSGPAATTTRLLRFGVQHVLRADGSTVWILPAAVARQVVASALGLDLNSSQQRHHHGEQEEKKQEGDHENAPAQSSGGDASASAAAPEWLLRVSTMRVETQVDGKRAARVTLAASNDASSTSFDLPLPPIRVYTTYDTATGAEVTVRYDQCPVPDPQYLPPTPTEPRQPPMYKRSRQIMKVRDAQGRVNVAHLSERRALLGGLWAGMETDDSGVSVIFDGNGTGPQLGRTAFVSFPDHFHSNGVHGTTMSIHAEDTHIVIERDRGNTGTAMKSRGHIGRAVSACRGFATTEIDCAYEAVAYGHARQDKGVATSASGPRTRSVTTLPDGSTIGIDYDCAVTAIVAARIRVARGDGSLVVALLDGRVQFRPSGVTAGLIPTSVTGQDDHVANVVAGAASRGRSESPAPIQGTIRSVSPPRGRSSSPSTAAAASSTRPRSSSPPSSAPASAAQLLAHEPHWDLLYAAAAIDTGRGLVPEVPEGAYEFWLPASDTNGAFAATKDKQSQHVQQQQLVMRTRDPGHNVFTVARPMQTSDGASSSSWTPDVQLAGCSVPAGASLVPAIWSDPSRQPLISAAIPGYPPGSSIVLPDITSPRPPSLFIIHADGSGRRLMDPSEWMDACRLAAASSLPPTAYQTAAEAASMPDNTAAPLPVAPANGLVADTPVAVSPPPPSPGRQVGASALLQLTGGAPVHEQGPHAITQVFIQVPTMSDPLLLIPSRRLTGHAQPVVYAANSSGCGLTLSHGRDEIRTSQAAWVIPRAGRGRRYTVQQVFGSSARLSPKARARGDSGAFARASVSADGNDGLDIANGLSMQQQQQGTRLGGTAMMSTAGGVTGRNSPLADGHANSLRDTYGQPLSALARALRKRLLPVAVAAVPDILTPPYSSMLPYSPGSQNADPTSVPTFALPNLVPVPHALAPVVSLFKSVSEEYQLSSSDRVHLAADESRWRQWRADKAASGGEYDNSDHRPASVRTHEVEAGQAILHARTLTAQHAPRRPSLLLKLRAAASATGASEGLRREAEATAAHAAAIKAAAEAAEYAAATAAARQHLRSNLLGQRGAYVPLGSLEARSGVSAPPGGRRIQPGPSAVEELDPDVGTYRGADGDLMSSASGSMAGRGYADTMIVAIKAEDGSVIRVRVPRPGRTTIQVTGQDGTDESKAGEGKEDAAIDDPYSTTATSATIRMLGPPPVMQPGEGTIVGVVNSRPVSRLAYEVTLPRQQNNLDGLASGHQDTLIFGTETMASLPSSMQSSLSGDGSTVLAQPGPEPSDGHGGVAALEADIVDALAASQAMSGSGPNVAQQQHDSAPASPSSAASQVFLDPKTGRPYDERTRARMRIAAVRRQEQDLARKRAAALEARRRAELANVQGIRGPSNVSSSAAAAVASGVPDGGRPPRRTGPMARQPGQRQNAVHSDAGRQSGEDGYDHNEASTGHDETGTSTILVDDSQIHQVDFTDNNTITTHEEPSFSSSAADDVTDPPGHGSARQHSIQRPGVPQLPLPQASHAPTAGAVADGVNSNRWADTSSIPDSVDITTRTETGQDRDYRGHADPRDDQDAYDGAGGQLEGAVIAAGHARTAQRGSAPMATVARTAASAAGADQSLEALIAAAAPGALMGALLEAGMPVGPIPGYPPITSASSAASHSATAVGDGGRDHDHRVPDAQAVHDYYSRSSGAADRKDDSEGYGDDNTVNPGEQLSAAVGHLAAAGSAMQAAKQKRLSGTSAAPASSSGALAGLTLPSARNVASLPAPGSGIASVALGAGGGGALAGIALPASARASTASVPAPQPGSANPAAGSTGGVTASVSNSAGLSITPGAARLGLLEVGHTYAIDLLMHHTGNGLMRWRVDRAHAGPHKAAAQGNSVRVVADTSPLAR